MDSRRINSQEELVDLMVSDRIKQTLSDECLKHVLSAEGGDWFHTKKLISVVDTFVNSRLNMGAPRKGSDAAKPSRFGFKNSGRICRAREFQIRIFIPQEFRNLPCLLVKISLLGAVREWG